MRECEKPPASCSEGAQLVEAVLGKGFLDLPAFNLAEIIAKDSGTAAIDWHGPHLLLSPHCLSVVARWHVDRTARRPRPS